MVSFEEDASPASTESPAGEEKEQQQKEEERGDVAAAASASQERLLDAEAIEEAAAAVSRPTARMQLESLAKKLRREAEALGRLEKSRAQAGEVVASSGDEPTAPAGSGAPAAFAQPHQSPSPPKLGVAKTSTAANAASSSVRYVPIDRFAFDAGGYSAPFVTLYVDLPGVGTIDRSKVKCEFTKTSFDLVVHDLQGKSYRLFRDDLEKDIDPDKSKIVVKSDRIVVKLAKVKTSEYGAGYDYWTKLTDSKKKSKKLRDKENPAASIMDLMKDMYDEGDDNMKKVIGEAMMKQRTGEMDKDGGMGGLGGMGGMGGGGGLGGMDDDDDF